MDSILDLAKTEAMLFKFGSGAGTQSLDHPLARRSCSRRRHRLGPGRFMRGYDAFAGVIKSGGKTRRAAKMVILNADHPDIVDFIESKDNEEKKAWALIEAGYDGSFNRRGLRHRRIPEREPLVRVTDEFMKAVATDGEWTTRCRHRPTSRWSTYKARDLMRKMAESAWRLRRPGHAVRHDDQRLAHVPEHGPHQRVATRAPSTCSSTTRPATWRQPQPDELRRRRRRVRRRGLPRRLPRSSSPRRRSPSTTRRIRRRAIEKNSHAFRPLGSATRTSARC